MVTWTMMNISEVIFFTGTFNESEQLAVEAFYDRRFPSVVMLILFSIVGIPGNIIVLLVYFSKRLTSTQFLISVIAMVDLFTAGVAIPIMIAYLTAWFSILNVTFCKISKGAAFIGTYPGVYLIWGLSFIRYYHICRPHELYFVEKKVKAFCVFVFGMTLFFGGCTYIIAGNQTSSEKELPAYDCYVADNYKGGVLHIFMLVVYLVILLFCLISIVILYCLILRRVLKQKKIMNKYKNNTFNKSEQLLANEENSKPEIVFTDQRGTSFVSSLSPDKSSDDKSHISHRSNKQTHTTTEQLTDKVGAIEITRGRIQKRKKNKRKYNNSSGSQSIIYNNSIGFYRTTFKVAIIGTVYVLTYVPFLSITIYLAGEATPRAPLHNIFKYGLIPGRYLGFLGCAVNPVVYFGDPIFRSKCKAIFRKK